MFLRRIQVPDFRALKDVDITFEPEFSPHIFPLSSLNGGGKSTLLQLIFVLLSCSGDSDKHIFIQNMLDGFEVDKKEKQKTLATVYLIDNKQDVKLHFFCHTNDITIRKQEIDIPGNISGKIIKLSSIYLEDELQKKILRLEMQQKCLRVFLAKFRKMKNTQYSEVREELFNQELKNMIDQVKNISLDSLHDFLLSQLNRVNTDINPIDMRYLIDCIIQKILEEEIKIGSDLQISNIKKNQIESKSVLNYIKKKDISYICNYTNHKREQEYALLCNSESVDMNEANKLLKQLSTKIFLAAPFTQVFLFLPKDVIRLLFKESNSRENYYSILEETKRKLPNLFTYDILTINFIIESFKAARDKDFQQAIESGEYGDAYKSILKELNSLLGNKKINIDADLSGVNFKIDSKGENQELYPEDLSHGELKRLSIYVWLKYKNIEDSIVLMDEIENAFHPDWQYQIISDLAEWGASNQYILATHSYELCQALTPAHVKELEPKLLADKQIEK